MFHTETGLGKLALTQLASHTPGWVSVANGYITACKKAEVKKTTPKERRLKVACWNIPKMQDFNENDRPHKCLALVARKLAHLDINIAALSKVKFAEQGSLTEEEAGYTLYWIGKGKENHRLSGVGFVIKTSNLGKTKASQWVIRTVSRPSANHSWIIASSQSSYAPTFQTDNKKNFYRELRYLLSALDSGDKIFIMGDFNA